MVKAINMAGQTTENGVYIIEKYSIPKQRETHWRCICPICKRKNWIVKGSRLRGKNQATMCKECSCKKNLSKIKEPYFKDISGQRFGKLVVIERENKKNKTTYLWKCICDCGNICIKDGEYLRNGDTSSCGMCENKSKGELKIKSILDNNNIHYTMEKSFDNFIYQDTQRKPRFDFQVFDDQNNFYLIEYDGKQHFETTYYSQNLEENQQKDKIKDNWCLKNNIPLIRIPYTHYNNLHLEDLLLQTSNFIVKEDKLI